MSVLWYRKSKGTLIGYLSPCTIVSARQRREPDHQVKGVGCRARVVELPQLGIQSDNERRVKYSDNEWSVHFKVRVQF